MRDNLDASRFEDLHFQTKPSLRSSCCSIQVCSISKSPLVHCVKIWFICVYICTFAFSRIEKSREVLPQLVHAITNCPKDKEVNWRYFYQLLFTVSNLKLVDIRCHRKDKHENYKVDKRKVYVEAVSC